MIADADTGLGSLIDDVIAGLEATLTAGLTPERSDWALYAYREIVLPRRLAGAPWNGNDGRRQAIVAVAELVAELAPIEPSARWVAIRTAFYRARLAPLAEVAREAAAHADAGAGEALRQEVSELVDEIDQHAPECRPALEPLIAETLADSGRAGARSDAACRACGHTNQPDSRFCNQCGARLG